jgi:nicotinate-nucleotide pyrophosphorylase
MNFLTKMMMKAQLKKSGLPKQQQDMLLIGMEKNPKLFESIAKEIKVEMKKGKGQQVASMEVMRRHQGELQKLFQQ